MENITNIHIAEHFDGPLSGILEYEGELHYFYCLSDVLDDAERTYKVVKLSAEQQEYEKRCKADWDTLSLSEYFTKYPPPYPDYRNNELVGTITEDQLRNNG